MRYLLIAMALSGCAMQRAQDAGLAQEEMKGMSREQVLSCMGVAGRTQKLGRTEVWAYSSGGDSISRGAGAAGSNVGFMSVSTAQRYCIVSVVFERGKVKDVKYSGRTGGLATGDEQCAFAVKNCIGHKETEPVRGEYGERPD